MKIQSDHVDLLVDQWNGIAPGTDLGVYPALVRLIRSGRLLQMVFEQVAQAGGLTVRGDYEVLAALRRANPNPMQPTELARVSLVSNSGMTGRLDRLEEAGLLLRRPHPEDRRAVLIEITEQGTHVVDSILDSLVRASSELMSPDLADLLDGPLRRLLVDLGDSD